MFHCVKRGRACRSTAKTKAISRGLFPAQHQEEKRMIITTSQVGEIRTEFVKLKPEKITLDGNRSLSVKEAVFALTPTLERTKKRVFDTQEIAQKLYEKGIGV
jgi:FKBP-type peptidyl-prolyl cis-trans isomerase 2